MIFLLLVAAAIFRGVVRRDYLRRGRLTLVSSLLESIFWCPVFAVPYIYNPPSWPLFWRQEPGNHWGFLYAGSGLIILGVVGVILVMARLGFGRSFGQKVDILQVSGPYAFTRNPQILAGFPIFVGIALRWPSWYALGWVLTAAACLHMMVTTEEEHLSRVFGGEYAAYCSRVPRYIAFRLRRDRAAR
jgi:protein-S-isoprenylcysteine O-methyltransferase Ste14